MGLGAIAPCRIAVFQYMLRHLILKVKKYRERCRSYMTKKDKENNKVKNNKKKLKSTNNNQNFKQSTYDGDIQQSTTLDDRKYFRDFLKEEDQELDALATILSDDFQNLVSLINPNNFQSILDRSIKMKNPVGLINRDIYCYINVVLQTLCYLIDESDLNHERSTSCFKIPSIGKKNYTSSTLSTKRRKGSNTTVDIQENRDTCKLCIIREQLKEMKVNMNPIVPTIFLKYLSAFFFKPNTQEDPGELAIRILPLILASNVNPEGVANQITCKECGKITTGYEETNPSLELALNNESTLSEVVYSYFNDTTDTIEKACCKESNVECNKTVKIMEYPKYLQLVLKRFTCNSEGASSKLENHISFEETLELPKYERIDSVPILEEFNLVSVVVHVGRFTTEGHYYCFIKYENCWWKINDDEVNKTNWDTVKIAQAYILFYSKSNPKNKTNLIVNDVQNTFENNYVITKEDINNFKGGIVTANTINVYTWILASERRDVAIFPSIHIDGTNTFDKYLDKNNTEIKVYCVPCYIGKYWYLVVFSKGTVYIVNANGELKNISDSLRYFIFRCVD